MTGMVLFLRSFVSLRFASFRSVKCLHKKYCVLSGCAGGRRRAREKSPEQSRAGSRPLPRVLHAGLAAFFTQHDPQQGRDSTTLQDGDTG
jgi:hypothetical protein